MTVMVFNFRYEKRERYWHIKTMEVLKERVETKAPT